MRRNCIAIFLLVAGALTAPAIGVSVVNAHAALQGQTPSANENLKSPPQMVSLLAGEQGIGTASSDYVSVLDASGANHASSLTTSARDNATVINAPVTSMSRGWYGVHWNIASEDGHPMGGDSGAWWAFGVNGATPKASAASLTVRNATPPTGAKGSIIAKLNGARVGARTISTVNKWARVYSVKWVLADPVHESLNNATFIWFASCAKKTSTCVAKGVLPFAGTYQVTFQVITTTKTGSNTALWTTSLLIRP